MPSDRTVQVLEGPHFVTIEDLRVIRELYIMSFVHLTLLLIRGLDLLEVLRTEGSLKWHQERCAFVVCQCCSIHGGIC